MFLKQKQVKLLLGAQGARLDRVVPEGKRHRGIDLLQLLFHLPVKGQVGRQEHHPVVVAELLVCKSAAG